MKTPIATAAALVAAILSQPAAAGAAETIGSAVRVVNTVTGQIGGTRQPVTTGSEVFQDEIVRTAPRASAALQFNDRTTLSLGSNSEVVLDEFVYRPGAGSGRIFFKTARGALRFVTGQAAKSAYRVTTPTATIGVRGTDFDVYVDRFRSTLVLLRNGIIRACRGAVANVFSAANAICRNASQPRTFIIVTTRGIQGPFPWNGQSPFDILFGNRPGPGSQGRDDGGNRPPSGGDAPPQPQGGGGGGGGGGDINID